LQIRSDFSDPDPSAHAIPNPDPVLDLDPVLDKVPDSDQNQTSTPKPTKNYFTINFKVHNKGNAKLF